MYPELDCDNHQGVQHKTYVDHKFVRGWRERKSFYKTYLIVSEIHSHCSKRKNKQNTLKRTRKSYNDKSMVRRPTSSGNNYKVWTRKTQQTLREDFDKVIPLDGIPKDNVDVKSIEPIQSSPDTRQKGANLPWDFQHRSILKQYIDSDQVYDNGKLIKSQLEIVPPSSINHVPLFSY